MIELRTLGTLSLRGADGVELHTLLAQPKRLALLVYLCVATPRGFHRRDTLLGLFWPEADEVHARGSLRKALHVLRRALGDEVIVARGEEEVGVAFDLISCDVVEFFDLIESRRFDEALNLYRGDLLPGFFLDEVPVFEQWLETERSCCRDLAARAAGDLRESLAGEGRYGDAVGAARKAVSFAQTDERALRHLVELLDRVGDPTGAIAAYDTFTRDVADRAGVVPSPETQRLVERIRARRATVRDPDNVPGKRPFGPTPPSAQDASRGQQITLSKPTPRAISDRTSRRSLIAVGLAAFVLAALVWGVTQREGPAVATETRRQLTFIGDVLLASSSPEGQFIAYAVPRGDSESVVVQDIAGSGGPHPLVTVKRTLTLEWSPDGTQLLVGAPRQAVVIPRAGGSIRPVRIPPLPGPTLKAYWLPDGKRISVHVPIGRRVFLVDLATEDTVSIPIDRAHVWMVDASWSPDGQALAMMTTSGTAAWTIVIVNLTGRTTTLVQDTVRLSSPRWTHGGDTIYYVRNDTTVWRVAVSRDPRKAHGTPQKAYDQLDLLVPLDMPPRISIGRDGRLVYVKGQRFSNLWLIEFDGSKLQQQRLTTGTEFRWGAQASPDGEWVAFAQETRDGAELFRMKLTGGNPEQVTFGARVTPMTDVAWSPAGNELAFLSERSGRSQVWVASLGNRGQTRVLAKTASLNPLANLAWAPSRRIAYSTSRRGVNLVDPSDGLEKTLVESDAAEGRFMSMRFSSDGNLLAMSRVLGSGSTVVVYDIRDSSTRTLASLQHWPRGWSDDGGYVYSQDMRSIHKLDTRGGRPPELLITLPWRNAQCGRAGPRRPHAFLCTVQDYVSDAWEVRTVSSPNR